MPACSKALRQAIQDEIIALSEEYHIITPYTSLLVLESDADRERFKVKRRFQMRDGEKFFADGRDNANYELMQQQMRRAGDWRIRLRAAVLRELSTLGREPGGLQGVRGGWNRRGGLDLGTTKYDLGKPKYETYGYNRRDAVKILGGARDELLGEVDAMFSLGDTAVGFDSGLEWQTWRICGQRR